MYIHYTIYVYIYMCVYYVYIIYILYIYIFKQEMTERPKQAAIFVAPAGCTRAAPLRDARSHNPRWLGSAPAFAKKKRPKLRWNFRRCPSYLKK
jgi:hypothetical protein